jgi:hypothetical protein
LGGLRKLAARAAAGGSFCLPAAGRKLGTSRKKQGFGRCGLNWVACNVLDFEGYAE